MGPLGCYFLSTGLLLVTEASSNALSSYSLSENGELNVVSGSVQSGWKTACWVITTKNERFAFITNTLSGTISTYRIERNGTLTVVGYTTSTPAGMTTGLPMDVGVSKDGKILLHIKRKSRYNFSIPN